MSSDRGLTLPPQSHDDIVAMVERLHRRLLTLEAWKSECLAIVDEASALAVEREAGEGSEGDATGEALDAANAEFWEKFQAFQRLARKGENA